MFKRLVLSATTLLIAGMAIASDGAPYVIAERWALGGDGGWDYLSVDGGAHLLYLSRATHVAIVDLATGKIAGDIDGTPGVHGIALAPDLGRGYISAGKANQVKVFDLNTRQVTASIDVGSKPDAILYDRHSHRVVVFNGHGDSATIIDAVAGKLVATLNLGGAPEFARSDEAGHVYVNIENKNELAAIDIDVPAVTAHWALPGCDAPSGLALDAAHHRSFSVCSNAAMAILDTQSGKSLATLPIGHGVDGAEFDSASQNAFSANGDGTLTVVHEADPDHFSVVQNLATANGARTIALDAVTHRIYLPTASFGSISPSLLDPHPKSPILPNSFVVLVVAPAGKN
ncbi:MAG: YncE family protein [Steroidobacteraceae bacterium]|jgi:YVTN family beta-propeller protein